MDWFFLNADFLLQNSCTTGQVKFRFLRYFVKTKPESELSPPKSTQLYMQDTAKKIHNPA